MTIAHGSDGTVALPSGFGGASLNTWSATLTRSSSLVTGFGSTGAQRRQSAVMDITGSAGGFMEYGAGATAFAYDVDTAGVAMTLTVATSNTIAFDALISSIAMGVTQDGDSTITFNFEMDDSNGPTIAWTTA